MNTLTSLAAQAGLELTGRVLPTRGSSAWVARRGSDFVILRRLDPGAHPPDEELTRADMTWLHQFLAELAEAGFPCPAPIPAFDGASYAVDDGAWWELVTFLPGNAVGWSQVPSLVEVGRLMARYHQASADLAPRPQRPSVFPVGELHEHRLEPKLRRLQRVLADRLDDVRHHEASQLVIHGDFTAHNVVADGDPLAVTGVIDFALAHIEAPLADLGFSLWRSGRAHQDAIALEPDRIYDLVRGYVDVTPLTSEAADAIATYTLARGVQQSVKSYLRNGFWRAMLARRTRWLARHHDMLSDNVLRAIKDRDEGRVTSRSTDLSDSHRVRAR